MAVVWEWPLPSAEKLVALKLADCADDDGGNSYPAVGTIAAVCGLTRRGAQLVLRKLQKRGCIEVQSTGTPSRRATVTYRVRLEAIVAPPVDAEGANDVRGGERRSREPGSRGGRTTFAGGANLVRGGGEPSSPDPSGIRPLTVPEHTPRARVDAQFEELTAIYPSKARELAARKAWETLSPTLELATFIVAHVRMRLRADWKGTPRRFVPYLVNFLEERRWEEREAAQAAQGAARCEPDPEDEARRVERQAEHDRRQAELDAQLDALWQLTDETLHEELRCEAAVELKPFALKMAPQAYEVALDAAARRALGSRFPTLEARLAELDRRQCAGGGL
jgi:hypothetical protein